MDKNVGCFTCKHLDFYEAYFEEPEESGWFCSIRCNIDLRRFPYKRKCKWADKLNYLEMENIKCKNIY
jgi:hypothetical protein